MDGCETRGKRDTPLAGEPSLLHTEDKETRTQPTSAPTKTEQRGTEADELGKEMQRMTLGEAQREMAGKERKTRVELWESLRVPKEEVEYRRRRGIPP